MTLAASGSLCVRAAGTNTLNELFVERAAHALAEVSARMPEYVSRWPIGAAVPLGTSSRSTDRLMAEITMAVEKIALQIVTSLLILEVLSDELTLQHDPDFTPPSARGRDSDRRYSMVLTVRPDPDHYRWDLLSDGFGPEPLAFLDPYRALVALEGLTIIVAWLAHVVLQDQTAAARALDFAKVRINEARYLIIVKEVVES